jgi:hypothetical protein
VKKPRQVPSRDRPNLSGRKCPGFSIFVGSLEQKNNVHFVTYWQERIRCSRVMMSGAWPRELESVMEQLYLGIAVTGLNALVAMAVVLAFLY